MLRRLAERRPRLQAHRGPHRGAAALRPRRPRRALPRLARARGVPVRPARADRRRRGALREGGAAPSTCTPSASSRSSATAAATVDGGTVHFRVSDCEAECDAGVSILVGGEEAGASCRSAAGWASATPASAGCRTAPSATSAPARRAGQRPDDPHLHQRPRRPCRDRSVRERNPLSCPKLHRRALRPREPAVQAHRASSSRSSARSSTRCTTRSSATSARSTRATSAT